MSFVRTKKIAIALAILGVASLMSGCGPATPTGANPYGANPYGTGGCIPISQPIGFTGTADMDNNYVWGGSIPATDSAKTNHPGQYGGITMTTGAMPTGTQYQYNPYPGLLTPQGAVQFNFTPQGPAQGWTATSAMSGSINGIVMISQAAQQQAYAAFGMSGYTSTYNTTNWFNPLTNPTYNTGSYGNVCASGFALSFSRYSGTGYLYYGYGYIYLNGTQHGILISY
jgi:hypothetical protein